MNRNQRSENTRFGAGDRIALLVLIAFSTIVSAGTLVAAVQRIIEVIVGRSVWVYMEFIEAPLSVPLIADAPPMAMTLDAARFHIDNPSTVTSAWLISSAALGALCTVAIIVSLLLLGRNALRDRVFSRRNTALVSIAGVAFLIQVLLVPNLENFGTNQVLTEMLTKAKPNEAIVPVIGTFAVGPFLIAALVSTLAVAVFAIGERLQRDSEGLV